MGSKKLQLKPVDSPVRERYWNEFVEAHPSATPYHTLAWRETLLETFGYEPKFLLAYEDDEVVGAVPGFQVPELLGTSIVNPFCEYGFPLVAEDSSFVDLLKAMKEEVGRSDARLLKECGWTNHSGYHLSGYGGVQTGIVRRLSLEVSFEELYQHVFTPEARRKSRNAAEADLSVQEAESIEAFYDVYYETMRRKGSPQFPIQLFENAVKWFGDDFTIHTVMDGSEVIAGVTALHTDDYCSMWTAGSYDSSRRAHANFLLYENAIEKAARNAQSVIDFGRSEPGSGVDQFKRKFGGTSHQLVTFGYPPARTGRGDISGYKHMEPLSRKLSPVTTHERIGPKLKRFIHE